MKITFLGTGTSHGIPVIGCDCAVCRSADPKDTRSRCSLYIQSGSGTPADTALLVDTGPEFRTQCLTWGVRRLDAVFITHPHADHLHGIDDLRIFSYSLRESIRDKYPQLEPLPIYTNPLTKRNIESRFDYIFTPVKEGGGKPNLMLQDTKPYEKFPVGPFDVQSAPLYHGSLEVSGWIFKETRYLADQGAGFKAARDKNVVFPVSAEGEVSAVASRPRNPEKAARGIAYLTDCSSIDDATIQVAHGVEHLIIDGLRVRPHNTHFSFDQALEAADAIAPGHVWLIHLNHEMSHCQIDEYLQTARQKYRNLCDIPVHPAYDGLTLSI
ncbi:MAG: MBL fold metallo-hydrolase [Treponemataceae bacterium]|nr:MBL fold metallo-hydrolase [Treponemataceae bacterium]